MQLPFFLPMGTIVAICMLVAVLFASRFPYLGLNRVTHPVLLRIIGVITGIAGLWNVLWFAVRNVPQFWGNMALGSGVFMVLLSALLILPKARVPAWLESIRPILVIVLLGFGLYYGYTIYNL